MEMAEIFSNKDCDIEVWNDVQIEKRAERLSKIIMDKFAYPKNVDVPYSGVMYITNTQ